MHTFFLRKHILNSIYRVSIRIPEFPFKSHRFDDSRPSKTTHSSLCLLIYVFCFCGTGFLKQPASNNYYNTQMLGRGVTGGVWCAKPKSVSARRNFSLLTMNKMAKQQQQRHQHHGNQQSDLSSGHAVVSIVVELSLLLDKRSCCSCCAYGTRRCLLLRVVGAVLLFGAWVTV